MSPSIPYLLKRAQQAAKASLDEALKPAGVSASQAAVLRRLAEAPGLSGAELARRCWVTAQTMNELIAGMESAGLVHREADPSHGRIVRTLLTPAGEQVLLACNDAIDEVAERMLDGFTDTERAQLTSLLERCARSLESVPAGTGKRAP